MGKTKSVTFRRGGPLRKSDVLYYEGRKIEFVPNFTYLGVIMQTKGGYSGHIQNLKRKGISACTRVALRLPLTSMSLLSLERLLCTVILPSCMYGKHHIRRCVGMWLSNGLRHLWCGAGQCYFVSEECACKFCGCAGVDKLHLLRCEWASCEQMNMDNIQQIVMVLHACNRHT